MPNAHVWWLFAGAGTVMACALARWLDPRRAPTRVRVVSAVAVLVMIAFAVGWAGVATVLRRAPIEVVNDRVERSERRVDRLTPAEAASLPRRQTVRGDRDRALYPAECQVIPEGYDPDAYHGPSHGPHSGSGSTFTQLKCPIGRFVDHDSYGFSEFSGVRGSDSSFAGFGWECRSGHVDYSDRGDDPTRISYSISNAVELRLSPDHHVAEYTCRTTFCEVRGETTCDPARFGLSPPPPLYLVARPLFPAHLRGEANRLAASSSALTLLALLFLRRSLARVRATALPASLLAAPYRSTEPVVVDPIALAVRSHARWLFGVIAFYAAASVAAIIALSS